jgi:hypothetical protein
MCPKVYPFERFCQRDTQMNLKVGDLTRRCPASEPCRDGTEAAKIE